MGILLLLLGCSHGTTWAYPVPIDEKCRNMAVSVTDDNVATVCTPGQDIEIYRPKVYSLEDAPTFVICRCPGIQLPALETRSVQDQQ